VVWVMSEEWAGCTFTSGQAIRERDRLCECPRKTKWRDWGLREAFKLESAAGYPEVGSHGHAVSHKAITLLGSSACHPLLLV